MAAKILLLGSSGMAGHMVYYYLSNNPAYEIIDISHTVAITEKTILLDVTNKETVEELIKSMAPEYIINCIGVLIKGSENNHENAVYINAYFPNQLERLSKEVGAKLIQISTDCVFSGKKGGYREDDFKDGEDIYAQSKALGEIINDKDLTIRTSIIGPELKKKGEGLFHWFMAQQGTINGYKNAFWSGVTTLELARAIESAMSQRISGLYHLTSIEKISKYDLLHLFKKVWQKRQLVINSFEGKKVDKSLINTRKDFEFEVKPYEVMLCEQYQFMSDHPELYNHYYSVKRNE